MTRVFDLEAIGLVLLAAGLAALGLLSPIVPTGDLGVQARATVMGPIGLGAWALPWPFVVLGALFLMRRNPRSWPRIVSGYVLGAVGLWGFVMLAAPAATGAWGVALRTTLTGSAGVLAAVPAFVLLTLGIELVLGLQPTRIVRGLLRALVALTRFGWNGLLAWRRKARSRAAFLADVAQVRHALVELERDLAALEGLYAASDELSRWRKSVKETLRRLARADEAALQDARADASAWQSAVRDFARDRASEMAVRFRVPIHGRRG